MPTSPIPLFNRIIAADKAGKPLRLHPGDVMQLANLFAEFEITRRSQFEDLSAFGHKKRTRGYTKKL